MEVHPTLFTWHGLGQAWGYGSRFATSAYCIGQSSFGGPLVDSGGKQHAHVPNSKRPVEPKGPISEVD
jgi:hypothetical protein